MPERLQVTCGLPLMCTHSHTPQARPQLPACPWPPPWGVERVQPRAGLISGNYRNSPLQPAPSLFPLHGALGNGHGATTLPGVKPPTHSRQVSQANPGAAGCENEGPDNMALAERLEALPTRLGQPHRQAEQREIGSLITWIASFATYVAVVST